jgi:CRP-like cAMP-binding protein
MRAWFVPQGTRIEALRAAPELGSYSDRDLQGLLPYFDEVTLPAGTVVAREGERCSEFVVVLNGRLHTMTGCIPARTLRAGDSLGWEAMWQRLPNDATAVVDADAQLLVMSHAQFRAIKAIAEPPE